jgi:hypothetical protein
MFFTDRLKLLLENPKASRLYRKTNNESGPAGPLDIEKARDWEVSWQNGRGVLLLHTPRVPTPEGEDMPQTPGTRPDLTWDRGGSDTGTLLSDPNAPLDKIRLVQRDRQITEENLPMSFVERLASALASGPVQAASALEFRDVLKTVKTLYPEIRMQFPKPPTYVWNPKAGKDEKEGEAQLEPQKIKDRLKVRLSQLKWTLRMSDGVEEAELGFSDESTALFEIGSKANQLTITYFEPPQESKVTYDDSDPDEDAKNV